jgi:hypothetical protein
MICYNNTIAVKNTSNASYGPFGFASSGPLNTQLGSICRNNINIYRNGTNSQKTPGYFPFSNAFDNAAKSNNLLHPGDPKFTDFVNGDLTLLAGSPAIDAGVVMEEVSLDGYTIPAYNDPAIGSIDVGAYEYGQTSWNAGITNRLSPTELSASDITSTGFILNWLAAPTPEKVTVYEAYSGDILLGTAPGSAKTMKIDGLTSNTNYQVILKAKDSLGNFDIPGSPVLSVTTLMPTSITELTSLDVKIYACDHSVMVDLSNLDGNSRVIVYNSNGSVIKIQQSGGHELLRIPVSASGILLVQVENDRKTLTKKVVLF